ncbi:ketopantoate reductase family protein [Paenibacillus sp. SAF-054]|uniref:ketopantoate reductase family protein n=1 Tax=unclassified Paenibacillus TaxID=185978 RepID=UPI003F81E185
MTIDLIGGGSLGLLYGGKLAAAGIHVRIWCRSAEQAAKLSSEGISIRNTEGDLEVSAKPEDFTAGVIEEFAGGWMQEPGEWIFLMTKQKDAVEVCSQSAGRLASASDKLSGGLQPGIICFQNGYGHMEVIDKMLPGWPLFVAVTTEGAKRLSQSEVLHAGAGTTWMGRYGKEHAGGNRAIQPEDWVKMLQKAGFSAELSNDIDSRVYRKLLINAVINPLTALWNIPNGELLSSQRRLSVMRMLLDEALEVYDACGIPWDKDIWDQIVGVCASTSGNTSSMLKDVQEGVPTEVEWINGSIASLARKAGMRALNHELVTGLIQGLTIREE